MVESYVDCRVREVAGFWPERKKLCRHGKWDPTRKEADKSPTASCYVDVSQRWTHGNLALFHHTISGIWMHRTRKMKRSYIFLYLASIIIFWVFLGRGHKDLEQFNVELTVWTISIWCHTCPNDKIALVDRHFLSRHWP